MRHLELGETENQLIAAIYEAALAPQLWCKVIAELRQLLGEYEISLFFYDERSQQRNFVIKENKIITNDVEKSELQEDVYKIKQLLYGIKPGEILTPYPFMQGTWPEVKNYKSELASSTKQQTLELKAVIPLLMKNNICAAIGIYGTSNVINITPDQLLFIQRLTPHFIRAIEIQNRLNLIKQDHDSILEIIKRMPLATFIVNTSLRVSFISPEANTLFSYHPALTLNKDNHLQTYYAKEQRQLETVLRNFIYSNFNTNDTKLKGINLPLTHPQKKHPLKLRLSPLSANQPASVQVQNPRFIVFANDPQRPRLITAEYLQQAYDLSRSEAHIAQLLLQGLFINEIADSRNTGVETIRGHVKHITRKTNTHSQAELVRLLSMLSGEFASPILKPDIIQEAFL